MIFEVRRRRRRGIPLDKVDFGREPAVVGDLRVEETSDPKYFGRTVQMATLHSFCNTRDPYELPPLYDVHLVGVASLAMVLTGIEFADGVGYAQTWWCVGRGTRVHDKGGRGGLNTFEPTSVNS